MNKLRRSPTGWWYGAHQDSLCANRNSIKAWRASSFDERWKVFFAAHEFRPKAPFTNTGSDSQIRWESRGWKGKKKVTQKDKSNEMISRRHFEQFNFYPKNNLGGNYALKDCLRCFQFSLGSRLWSISIVHGVKSLKKNFSFYVFFFVFHAIKTRSMNSRRSVTRSNV
jgi:hypothetical protein